jgi:type I restriction enzyme M protein
VIHPLETVSNTRGYRLGELIRAWIGALATAVAAGERDPAPYLRSDLQPFADRFQEATLRLIETLQTGEGDPLACAYMDYLSDGWRGQFFTPWPLAEFLAQTTVVDTGQPLTVYDPTCGAGSLLLAAARALPDAVREGRLRVVGQDLDPFCAQMARVSLALAGVPAEIHVGNTLDPRESDWEARYDVVLANPPFGAWRDEAPPLAVPKTSSEMLFLQYACRVVAPGGRIALISSDGPLANQKDKPARAWLLRESGLQLGGVVSLPAGAFQPHTGVKISAVYLFNQPPPPDYWVSMSLVGEGLRLSSRRPLQRSDLAGDIPEIAAALERARTQQQAMELAA